MRKRVRRIRRKNVRVRHLEPSDLDEYETPELEDWMTASGGK